MKHSLLDNPAVPEVLGDDPLEKCGRNACVPHTLGVHDDDWPAGAHAQARRLTAFDPVGTKQESLALQQRGQQLVQLAPSLVGRAESAYAHEHVPCVRIHEWEWRHARNLAMSD